MQGMYVYINWLYNYYTCETRINHNAYVQLAVKSAACEGVTKQITYCKVQSHVDTEVIVNHVNIQLDKRLKNSRLK